MYDFYLGSVQLPVTPEKLSIKIANQNKTIQLINEGEVNILKAAGLSEVSFTALIPQVRYPFAIYRDGFKDADYFLGFFQWLKNSKKPFQFKVTRVSPSGKLLFNTDMKVSLEDYSIEEDAKNGFDLQIPIRLKQFRDYGTKKVEVRDSGDQKVMTVTNPRPSSKEIPKTYKVVAGDSLWKICKKQLGDGSKYQEIAKLNGLVNPNSLSVGQVIRLG